MKKQTAVQWLTEKIFNLYGVGYGDIEIWNQAQDMEREQILNAYREGRTDQQAGRDEYFNRTSVQYYNETYKGGEQ